MDVARQVFVLLSVLVVCWGFERCEATGKFGFEVHHIFSDSVKQSLGLGDLVPEQGSLEYFKVLAHRDRLIRGRGLASNNDETPITFDGGNLTVSVKLLGSLYYANVSVGTPPSSFLVALDTGSDLFWLPCNCGTTCIRDLEDIGVPQSVPLNLYTPNASTTSSSIRCSDKRCFGSKKCSSPSSICPYQISYSNSTGTKGTLLQDVLHLATEDENLTPVKANVTLGCGQKQTGLFQRNNSVNGVLGLGIKGYSVPSLLAKANITANSFSMCFGRVIGNVGRISFGDRGYTDQEETPFISVAPRRRPVDPELPFEFCYDLSPNATTIQFPLVEMTFIGGSKIILNNPFFTARTQARHGEGNVMYCLGVLKSVGLKINNFVAGYRIVFDRERMILGWKQSLCFEDESLESTTPPPPEVEAPAPSVSAPPPRSLPPTVSATPPPINPRNSTGNPGTGGAANLIPLASQLLLLLPLLAFL
ncbi:putative protein [Arabidopsis thaliana]|uniref:Uncharacterized protein F24M12.390 n=1 Tax=Arabidopsis thaliana TaxID=3702 RepID=Q9SD14_ARATH|nr:putative protein [Arabidopsis thaliana]